MNKEDFYSTEPDIRVDTINKMLLNRSVSEVAKEIGIPSSSFSKEMTNGDYVYIKRENQYYKFVRDISDFQANLETDDATAFVNKNMDTLKKIVSLFKGKTPLILDESIYVKNADYSNKNVRMNNLIYSEFTNFCGNNYPTYRLQDLFSQALIDFTKTYNK